MTTSQWDKVELTSSFPECGTLKEILARIEEDFSRKGEVICEIRVNGVILEEGDETRIANSPRDQIQDIAVRSNRPVDLINSALDSALEFLPQLEDSSARTGELFRGSDLGLAQTRFHETLEGCQWVIDTLMHVRGAASGIGQPISQPERWFEAEKIIAKVIREVSEAYTVSDYVLVADLLEYELTTAVSLWADTLSMERERR